MKFKIGAPLILITTMTAAVIALSGIAIGLSHSYGISAQHEQFTLMRKILEFNLKTGLQKALAQAEMIAALPDVKAAFAAQDRPRLLAETQEMFRIQNEKYGVDRAMFQSPNITSFLRINTPEKFGDDLSSYRPIVVDVNHNKEARMGVEVTRSGPGLFGVVPMRDDKGNFIGSFEIGIEIGPILEDLKATYGLDLAIYVEEMILKELSTSVGGDIINENNRLGKYIRFHSTHTELLRKLVTESEINIAEETRYEKNTFGMSHGVLLLPFFNYRGKQIGVIAITRDFSAAKAARANLIVWLGLAALFISVLMAGLILIVVRGSLMKPLAALNRKLEEFAGGATGRADADFDRCCVEIQQLAATCHKLVCATKSQTAGGS